MLPMFSEHISGANCVAAANLSLTGIDGLPPVVMLSTASLRRAMPGRKRANTSGTPVGRPVSGLRA